MDERRTPPMRAAQRLGQLQHSALQVGLSGWHPLEGACPPRVLVESGIVRVSEW